MLKMEHPKRIPNCSKAFSNKKSKPSKLIFYKPSKDTMIFFLKTLCCWSSNHQKVFRIWTMWIRMLEKAVVLFQLSIFTQSNEAKILLEWGRTNHFYEQNCQFGCDPFCIQKPSSFLRRSTKKDLSLMDFSHFGGIQAFLQVELIFLKPFYCLHSPAIFWNAKPYSLFMFFLHCQSAFSNGKKPSKIIRQGSLY